MVIPSHKYDSNLMSSILNVDFSQEALTIGEKQADLEGLHGMQYIKVDLRRWSELSSCPAFSEEEPLDFIFDKSTSDAISTNSDVGIASLGDEGVCPLLISSITDDINITSLDPLDLVALHLAALSRPGCLWAILSYSSSRFDFFASSNSQSCRYWSLLEKKPVQAPSGSDNPSAPPVYHWLYLFQRCHITNTRID